MRISKLTKHLGFLTALIMMTSMVWAQTQSPLDITLRHIEQNHEAWQLSKADVTDMSVSDQVFTKHNGVNHIYLMQSHAGIEVYNAILTANVLPNGEVFHVDKSNLIPNLSALVNTTTPNLSAYDAIRDAANHLGLSIEAPLDLKEREGNHFYQYEGGSISNSDIQVKLRYQPIRTISPKGVAGEVEAVRLAWDLAIDQKNNADYWSMRIDALTGKVLHQNNYTVYCSFNHDSHHQHGSTCKDAELKTSVTDVLAQQNTTLETNMMAGTYNVFAWPLESPSHGEQSVVTDPHSVEYSPFGWHDTNGEEGAEFTITRGNNVHAFLDLDDLNVSQGDEPDGGEALNFDFTYDPLVEPADQQELATIQLFYTNNMLHDFTANYGFDEAGGNFQSTNYSGAGAGGDYVNANAQDAVNAGGINNANFGTPPDGSNPTMQMYLWNSSAGALTINAPEAVEGTYNAGDANGWGADITEVPVTGEVVIVDDGTAAPTLGCESPINDITGKVALIDRGQCEFGLKALNAENEGAIGVIICNFEDGTIAMGGGAVGAQVTVPVVMLGAPDCNQIRTFAGNGLEVSFVIGMVQGPMQVDGDFDNGIVAHEFAHGISNRLTGGPNNTGCLSNIAGSEQMGEGWSDFFSLVTSHEPDDTADKVRGIGTFALRQPVNGRGIRRQPYSRDMSVNNQTYNDIIGTGVHATGEVWAVTLWDMYWNLIDEYGYDPDITNAEAGNNIAIQLVMDGMKLQGCNPGFIAGRDAILAADVANNDGANQCLIWGTFARRGVGFDAVGGDPLSNGDNQEGFETAPICRDAVEIDKTVTELINAGDEIEVSITVTSYKEAVQTSLMITDEIPSGTAYIAGSGSVMGTLSGNIVSFSIDDLSFEESTTISYRLSTDDDAKSITQFYDDMEDGDDNWIFEANAGADIWQITDDLSNSGNEAWFVLDRADGVEENDQVFYNIDAITVTGTQPVLRFYHYYNTEAGSDGGHLEISTDLFLWEVMSPDKFFKNGYTAVLPYAAPLFIPNLPNFTGQSTDDASFIPVMADLSEYAGQDVYIRWRFGTDDNTGTDSGWYVDDIEVMDLVNYNGEACVSSAEGETACASAIARGTIVQSDAIVSTKDVEAQNVSLSVQPNPANDYLNVSIVNNKAEQVTLTLITVDGKEVLSQQVQTFNGQQMIPVNVSNLAAGFYFVKVSTGSEVATEKVVIK